MSSKPITSTDYLTTLASMEDWLKTLRKNIVLTGDSTAESKIQIIQDLLGSIDRIVNIMKGNTWIS